MGHFWIKTQEQRPCEAREAGDHRQEQRTFGRVMAGLDPAIQAGIVCAWMRGSSPAMTAFDDSVSPDRITNRCR